MKKQQENKIRGCHVITRFLRGGGAKNTLYTIEGLDRNIFDVTLIAGRDVDRPQIERLEDVVTDLKSRDEVSGDHTITSISGSCPASLLLRFR